MGRLSFAVRMLGALLCFQSKSCPYCGHNNTKVIGRKKLLLDLRRCARCSLQFRYPKDRVQDNRDYYQHQYRQWHFGDLDEITAGVDAISYIGDEAALHIAQRVGLAREVVPEGRVLDFGCSWGYAPTVFRDAGHDVVGFEISRPRAEIGSRAFDLKTLSDMETLAREPAASFDLVYSSHVLEHLPDIGDVLRLFRRLVKEDGAAVFFVPNGGGEKARANGTKWGALISEEHCLALDAAFFSRALPETGFSPAFRSDPYVLPSYTADQAMGDELMVIARPMYGQELSV